jgi:hypothetical protein
MSEETAGAESPHESGGAGADPVAVSLALGGASQAQADAFLKKQEALIDDQRHHLREQTKSLKIGIFNERMSAALKLLTAAAGIAVAGSLGLAVWMAAHADGLVIDAFSVPAAFAQQGLTGEVVANRVLDRLTELQNGTTTIRAAQSFDNSWGSDIKVEIPETGVSFGEFYRYLKEGLGHESHLGGEVVRTAGGITLTARVGGNSGASFSGAEADLDRLVQAAAESVYGQTQPFRYAIYLDGHGRGDEAFGVYRNLAMTGSGKDRPWGYVGWAHHVYDSETGEQAMRLVETAHARAPDNPVVVGEMALYEIDRSRPEKALARSKDVLSILANPDQPLISASGVLVQREEYEARTAALTGDFAKAAGTLKDVVENRQTGQPTSPILAQYQVGDHDLAAARATLAAPPQKNVFGALYNAVYAVAARMAADSEAGDWAAVVAGRHDLDLLARTYPGTRFHARTLTVPLTAYAEAKMGHIAAAEAEIAATPADCYDCLRARARIAALGAQASAADNWFARAVAAAPSIPFAYADWGAVLLEQGKPDAAIAKFALANRQGPHFADPLELWGEALMAKRRSDLALAKFAAAEKYAPGWGRLHLKWGEALAYAGDRNEATKQFAAATRLQLTQAEKAELASYR